MSQNGGYNNGSARAGELKITAPATPQAKSLNGSYGGFQPKPAVEVIIVAMKPLSEKTYIDQALANGKGITWLDDGRIPTTDVIQDLSGTMRGGSVGLGKIMKGQIISNPPHESGRFPANLLVSDDVLDDYSRYFSLDKWAEQLPFFIVPKASKDERNKGLDGLEERKKWLPGGGRTGISDRENIVAKNIHPTVKPLKLMSYLITIGSRPGDLVMDPFAGSGTVCVAARNLGRHFIGYEISEEYQYISLARAKDAMAQKKLFEFVETEAIRHD